MTDEVTGGLPTATTPEPILTPKEQKATGLGILGSKGVVLGADQSSDIKARLLEMIAAREAEKHGLGAFVENMMPTVGPVEGWAQQAQVANAAKQNRNQDIVNMRMGIAQLEAQQQQLAQQRADKAAAMQGLEQRVGGGTAPTAGGAGAGAFAYPPQVANLLRSAYAEDSTKGRTMEADFQKQLMNPEFAKMQDVLYKDPTTGKTGTIQVPLRNVWMNSTFGTDLRNPMAAPTVATAPAATTSAATAPVATQPGAPIQVTTQGGLPTKEEAVLQQKAAEAEIAGTAREAEKMGERFAAEQTTLSDQAKSAPQNLAIAGRMTQHVKAYPDIVGKLNQPSVGSALANLVAQGVTTPYGSIALPQINEIATQLDPASRKDPKRMEAAQALARDFAYLQLQGSKVLNGQGAVSDNERLLIKNVVGDFTRLSPQNVLYVAKALELDAVNAREQQALWRAAENKGMTWKQFTKSPEFAAQDRKQYFRSANALGIKNPPEYPGVSAAKAPSAPPAAATPSAPVEDERARLRNRIKPQGPQ